MATLRLARVWHFCFQTLKTTINLITPSLNNAPTTMHSSSSKFNLLVYAVTFARNRVATFGDFPKPHVKGKSPKTGV